MTSSRVPGRKIENLLIAAQTALHQEAHHDLDDCRYLPGMKRTWAEKQWVH
jgi:hypothetical protein